MPLRSDFGQSAFLCLYFQILGLFISLDYPYNPNADRPG